MMTTKAMAWFFVFMSILNIPAMILFYKGNEVTNAKLLKAANLTSNATADD